MKEFVDQEKTRAEEAKAKPNPRFGWSNEETDNTLEEDLPLEIIHIIEDPNHPNLENRIWGEICMIRQMNEVLSVQSTAKKLRQTMFETRKHHIF